MKGSGVRFGGVIRAKKIQTKNGIKGKEFMISLWTPRSACAARKCGALSSVFLVTGDGRGGASHSGCRTIPSQRVV